MFILMRLMVMTEKILNHKILLMVNGTRKRIDLQMLLILRMLMKNLLNSILFSLFHPPTNRYKQQEGLDYTDTFASVANLYHRRS